MYLGIEIGGSKLQLGVGSGQGGSLETLERLDVDRDAGAAGIREQIHEVGLRLIERFHVVAVGIGFGGPVNAPAGRTIKSHQIEGWEDFPLADWCQENLAVPTVIGNDSDLAGLGEARFGAGRDGKIVFYSNVGSGIGGALVIGGELYSGGGGVASELGHLRPGPDARHPDQTVESLASGWAISAATRACLDPSGSIADLRPFVDATVSGDGPTDLGHSQQFGPDAFEDLLQRCDGDVERLTTQIVAQALTDGNRLAEAVFGRCIQTYGWALAQVITLLAPDIIVIGGGVPQIGEALFMAPLRQEVDHYVFPPLRGTFKILPAALGEEVVVHGALALAASPSLRS